MNLKGTLSFLKKSSLFWISYGWLVVLFSSSGWAATQNYRLILTEKPSTSLRIGWELIGGCPDTQRVYYDTIDHGQDTAAYAFRAQLTASYFHRDRENYFCDLADLKPDTRYYFVIAEDQGISPRLWFTTFPKTSHPWKAYWAPPTLIRSPKIWKEFSRQVAQHPVDFVLIEGFSQLQTEKGWGQWLEDWQASIADNGQIVPLLIGGELTVDCQYLFNITPSAVHSYPLNPQSTLITIADKKMPGKRFWKQLPSDTFVLLHTPHPTKGLPEPVNLALASSPLEAEPLPKLYSFPSAFPFVELRWQEGQLSVQSPQQESLLDVFATP